jgi:hypothetical protein
MINSTDAEQAFDKIHDKSTGETRKIKNIPQCNNGYMTNL